MTDSDLQTDVMSEGTQRGTPRRALFGPGCCGSESPINNVAEAQAGWPAENNLPEGARSPAVGLADTVARLQREVQDAIVISNGWDDVTAALQPLSHLEGDALNVVLLVLAPRRALPGGLVDALAAHYGSPG